jgi:hypothetical protein
MVGGVALAPVLSVAGLVILADEVGTDLYLESVKQQRTFLERGPAARNPYVIWKDYIRPDGTLPPELLKLWRQLHGAPENVLPGDPNEKIGTPGMGTLGSVKAGKQLSYTVYFENVASASAPAQEVIITDQLDQDLDWSTLNLTDISFGSHTIPIQTGGNAFSTSATIPDYRTGNQRNWLVTITGELSSSGKITWKFRTLDPETNDLPEDALAGFLPANNSSGRGEGHISFTVQPKSNLTVGTQITNSASIVFDQNAAMSTNTTLNTIGLPGDVNNDGVITEADADVLTSYLLSGGTLTGLADCNGDGAVTPLDVFYLINYLKSNGPEPLD